MHLFKKSRKVSPETSTTNIQQLVDSANSFFTIHVERSFILHYPCIVQYHSLAIYDLWIVQTNISPMHGCSFPLSMCNWMN